MKELMDKYPNLSTDMLLQEGCYLLEMNNGSMVSYDCRDHYIKKSWKLRGVGYEFNPNRAFITPQTSRHIEGGPTGIAHKDVRFLYNLSNKEIDCLHETLQAGQKKIHEAISNTEEVIGSEENNRYFCSPTLNVIVKIRPYGLTLNPESCKASALYGSEEELSLIPPHYTGYTWWYYPGRMYFSRVRWREISEREYDIIKALIIGTEQRVFNIIEEIIN